MGRLWLWLLIGLVLAGPVVLLIGFAGPILWAKHAGGGFYHVPSASMRPTIEVGDRVLADPWPGGVPPRGAIVVHRSADGQDYIRRVIALPGETVRMVGGVVEIGGVVAGMEHTGEYLMPVDNGPCLERRGDICASEIWTETLPGAPPHLILDSAKGGMSDDTAPMTVPEGHLFLMGDHRDNSIDSRNMIGPVALEEVHAIVTRVHYSIGDEGLRIDRTFLRVQ